MVTGSVCANIPFTHSLGYLVITDRILIERHMRGLYGVLRNP